MNFPSRLLKKSRAQLNELIRYGTVGALTTAVNLLCYEATRVWMPVYLAVALSWCASVAFAYFANRRFVFRTHTRGREMGKEIALFVTARLLSLGLDELFMWIGVDLLSANDRIVKILSNILVIIANYFASKRFIFIRR